MEQLFYKAKDGACADFIPFYEDGWFYLFYLKDYRNIKEFGEGCPWFCIRTKDFVVFEELGEQIERGKREDQDLFVFTGSVFHDTKGDGSYHIFYTGHNHYLKEQGGRQEAIMHAVSVDLVHWEKKEEKFYAPPGYEEHDWRDPYVFYNEKAACYNMILAGRITNGPVKHRGVTVLCSSKDLINWNVDYNLYEPNCYVTHECPDLFQMGDWWYLVFSEFSDKFRTRYVMSRSIEGPWIKPKDDIFDTRAYYAAKTAFDGKHRYLFGWLASRYEDTDQGIWQWGGNLVVHELLQRQDGTLHIDMPKSIKEYILSNSDPIISDSKSFEDKIILKEQCGFQSIWCNAMSQTGMIEFDIEFGEGSGETGVLIQSEEKLEEGYKLLFSLAENKMEFRGISALNPDPDFLGIDRTLDLKKGTVYHVTIVYDKTCIIVYFDHSYALCARMYRLGTGKLGFFTTGQAMTIKNMKEMVCCKVDRSLCEDYSK